VKKQPKNKQTKKQYAVFGAGKFGASVAMTLEDLGCEVMVVDRDPEQIQAIANHVSYAVCLNVEEPDAFAGLGLHNLDGAVVAFTENLEASIVTVMMCSEAKVPRIFAKARNQTHEKILKSVGAHKIIYPELEMGKRVANYIVADNFLDWIELSPKYSLVEIEIPHDWQEHTLKELKLREKHGINIIGYKQGDAININMNPDVPLPDKCVLILIGENNAIERIPR
jgi:trk system potassium uptake protein TrkA